MCIIILDITNMSKTMKGANGMVKRYTEEFKRMIVEQYKFGNSVKEICTQHNIARSTVFLWVKQYTSDEAGQIPREHYLMQKELERLRIENQIFKICGCAPASPLPDRLAAIDAHQKEFSLHALCRVLQVNRATYYYHALRAPKQTQLQIEDTALKPLVKKYSKKAKDASVPARFAQSFYRRDMSSANAGSCG